MKVFAVSHVVFQRKTPNASVTVASLLGPSPSWTFPTPVSFHSCIVTCGSDGDVRIWGNLDDDDPKSINVGEKAYSCALKVLSLTELF